MHPASGVSQWKGTQVCLQGSPHASSRHQKLRSNPKFRDWRLVGRDWHSLDFRRQCYSLIFDSFSSCCDFHLSPLHGRSHFLFFIPDPGTSFKGSVPPPNCIIEFRDSFLSEYTASEYHGRHLDKNLELDGETSVDWVERLEEQMSQQRDRAKLGPVVSFGRQEAAALHIPEMRQMRSHWQLRK